MSFRYSVFIADTTVVQEGVLPPSVHTPSTSSGETTPKPVKRREAQINQLRACLFPQHRSQWTGPDTYSTFLTLSHMMFIAQKTRVSDAWVKPTFAVDRYGAFDAQHSDALWIAAFRVNQDPHIRPRPDQPASCNVFFLSTIKTIQRYTTVVQEGGVASSHLHTSAQCTPSSITHTPSSTTCTLPSTEARCFFIFFQPHHFSLWI